MYILAGLFIVALVIALAAMAQTQTPNIYDKQGYERDYSPAADVYTGDIVVIGTNCFLATNPIAGTTTSYIDGTPATAGLKAFGVWKVNKDTSVFADGDPVFWLATGSPVVGTASTGAVSSNSAGFYVGKAVGAALTGDQYVYVLVGIPRNSGTSTELIGASTAAAGSTTTDAGVLPAGTAPNYPTTAADGTKGVRINAADQVTGRKLFIGNGVSNQILKVYAPSGGVINGAAADAAFSSASGKGVTVLCLSGSGNTWLAS